MLGAIRLDPRLAQASLSEARQVSERDAAATIRLPELLDNSRDRSSGAAGSHRRALPEPDVNLSAHPAPSVQPFRM